MSKTTTMEDTRGAHLRTKYYSMVPLHVLFMHFSVYYLPAKMLVDERGESGTGGAGWRGTMRVDALVDRPLASLLVINVATLLVQLWFANFLRAWKAALLAPLTTNKNTTHADGPRTGTRGLAKFTTLLSLRPDQIVATLVSEPAVVRGWLVAKEALMINGVVAAGTTAVLVLLGAPVGSVEALVKTLGLAWFVVLQTLFPASLAVGWNRGRCADRWRRIFSAFQPNEPLEVVLLFPACGAAFGAWLGAIPIPLDWDRPWQAWPITCLLATSAGNAIGHFAAVLHCLRSSS